MATPRRSSQQQQPNSPLSSPPRGSSRPATPPGCPAAPTDDATSLSRRAALDNQADGEAAPSSPTASPALALSASSSSSTSSSTSSSASSPTTTEGSESSPGSTPDSGSGDAASSSSTSGGGSNGAFRDLFEACRNGDVSRVKKLVDALNVNAKDMAGRKSTPLHFAAGKKKKIKAE
ncbi:Poly [ADP-ribose] polymerase tankyrase-1 [Dissostichus eleginoides]|uniref:Poly [ADP-ribose] polymerase tankyrase-1 n=1 Tax=Dissostichus eleginoides TaxID=100907 RepID=A0AAD9BKU1_DISEL|nr:Poly [ADP-ribose] polymerase tankyrase-1 [Dissostichus eleginoides]